MPSVHPCHLPSPLYAPLAPLRTLTALLASSAPSAYPHLLSPPPRTPAALLAPSTHTVPTRLPLGSLHASAHSHCPPGLLRSFCVPPPPFTPSTHPSRPLSTLHTHQAPPPPAWPPYVPLLTLAALLALLCTSAHLCRPPGPLHTLCAPPLPS
ncbi:hypothetical protein K439DRAFT_1615632 [Ramaria rubella]|nr:hypothetical protein K439DRAFT_1615632 [Ramaria rubella]